MQTQTEVTKRYHKGKLRECQNKNLKTEHRNKNAKKNFSSSEAEVLLQEVSQKQAIIFSSFNSEYKITNKRGA